jgi:N-acetylglutamate synthase-like GNAT family acetyltransferase
MDQDSAMIALYNLKEVPEQLPQLAAWHHEEWSNLNPGLTLAERIAIMRAELAGDAVPVTWVAMRDGELLGSASLIEHDMAIHLEKTPWLASVFVAPSQRRQGIGTTVVRKVMEHAALYRIPRIYLFTMDQEAFYRRLGWRTISRETYRGVDVIIMQSDLDQES